MRALNKKPIIIEYFDILFGKIEEKKYTICISMSIIMTFLIFPTISVHAGGFHPNKQYILSSYVMSTIQRIFIYNKLGNSVPFRSVGICEEKIIYKLNSRQSLSEFLKKEKVICNIVSRKSYRDKFEIRFPYIDSCVDVFDSFKFLQKSKSFDHLSYGKEFGVTIVDRATSRGNIIFDIKNFNAVEDYWAYIENVETIDVKVEKNKRGSNCLFTGASR